MAFRYDADTTVSDESLVRLRVRPYKRAASKSTDTKVRFRASNAEGMLHKFYELQRMQKSSNATRANSLKRDESFLGNLQRNAIKNPVDDKSVDYDHVPGWDNLSSWWDSFCFKTTKFYSGIISALSQINKVKKDTV